MFPEIGDDIFVYVVSSFLLVRDIGIIASVSHRCNSYLVTLPNTRGIWFVLMNSYFRNNSLYSFFINSSLTLLRSGPTRSDFALCTFNHFFSSHYTLGTPAGRQLPRMCISSRSWTSDEQLLKAISKSCKIHTEFFEINNFDLGIVEGIILSALLRRHQQVGASPLESYNILCDLYQKQCIDILDYHDIYALHTISIFASELYSRLLILFHSVLRGCKDLRCTLLSRMTPLLQSKDINCYRVFLDSFVF